MLTCNKTIVSTILLTGIFLSQALASPRPILIKGGTVITVTNGIIENGDVLLKDGKIANIAIFDGDPLRPLTRVSDVIIEGRRIPMKSYQTELYEKYR